MICKKCGREIDNDSLFCRFCGEQYGSISSSYINNPPYISQSSNGFNPQQLKEYLSAVLFVESEIVWQDQEIATLENNVKALCIPKQSKNEKPLSPKEPQKLTKQEVYIGVAIFLFLIASGLVALAFYVLNYWIPFINHSVFDFFVLLILGLISLFGVFKLIQSYRLNKQLYNSNYEKYRANIEKYDRALQEYNDAIETEKNRLEQEEIQKELIAKQIKKLKETVKDSRQRLDKLYSYNIIYPKYRNLVMVGTLCDYLSSGRCNSLEGSDGGYNILELEIRLDKICTSLDTIIRNLEAIKSSQYAIFNRLNENQILLNSISQDNERVLSRINCMDSNSALIRSSIEKLVDNSKLNLALQESTNKQLKYMNRMDYLSGKNNSVWNNIPPT